MLRERPDDLELACRLTPYARDEYEGALELPPVDDELERARRWWIRSTQAFGSVIEQNSNNARTVLNRIGRFATIEHRDALEVIDRYDAPDGVTYLDPPYLGSTRTSMGDGKRPGGDYAHEFATEGEHRDLAAVAHQAQATVIVSGYASELYDEHLYPDWYRLERRILARSANQRGSDNRHRTEVLWMNRPLDLALFAQDAR